MSQEQHHHIEVRSGTVVVMGASFGRRYVAVCKTCGWQGRDLPTEAAAERDGDEHAIAIT